MIFCFIIIIIIISFLAQYCLADIMLQPILHVPFAPDDNYYIYLHGLKQLKQVVANTGQSSQIKGSIRDSAW